MPADPNGKPIAQLTRWCIHREADARLIAAAPDLLEALKRLTEGMEASGGWDGDDEDFAFAMAAIAKASQHPRQP